MTRMSCSLEDEGGRCLNSEAYRAGQRSTTALRDALRDLLRNANSVGVRADIMPKAPPGYYVSPVAREHIRSICRHFGIGEEEEDIL